MVKGEIMDRTVAYLNIQHFKKLLESELDPAKRQMIERLLAEEEAKLVGPGTSNPERRQRA
jgi:hypothetical protein